MQVVAVSAGHHHGACIDVEGSLYSWGDNSHGQLGILLDGSKHSGRWPLKVQIGAERVAQVSCGGAHTVCITQWGSLHSWGKGLSGQLGHSDTKSQTKALPVSIGKSSFERRQHEKPQDSHWLNRLMPTNM